MRAFRVIGSFKIDKRKWQDFNFEVAAEDVEGATDKVLSTLGSRHRLNRKEIQIKDVHRVVLGLPPKVIWFCAMLAVSVSSLSALR